MLVGDFLESMQKVKSYNLSVLAKMEVALGTGTLGYNLEKNHLLENRIYAQENPPSAYSGTQLIYDLFLTTVKALVPVEGEIAGYVKDITSDVVESFLESENSEYQIQGTFAYIITAKT